MKKDQLFKLIGFFIVLAIICLFVVNNVFSVTEEVLYPLFSANSQVENIVFLIGDSMGLAQITSTRIKTVGVNGKLHMERMPATGLINTHSANSLVTDSGAAGTALATGYKTNNGMISVSPDDERLLTILEACKGKGMVTGLVVTSTITHSAPAAFAAHVRYRGDEATIASQLLENKVNVLLGGGKAFFLPQSIFGSKRQDERDLIAEAKKIGYLFVQTKEELKVAKENYLLGLFQLFALTTNPPEPSLVELTQKAIELLSQNRKGFFLMVEGSQIDWACHNNNPDNTIRQTLLFDEAIKIALDFALKDKHTLVVVTVDHECGGMGLNAGSLNGKSLIIGWTSKGHTGVPVPIYAFGPGAERFMGLHDNTEVPRIFAELLDIKPFPKMGE
jgi:alkaline phosphatase